MLKNLLITPLLILLTVCHTFSQESSVQYLGLQDCIDYAFENNAGVIDADLERSIAEGTIGEVLSEGLPQVNLDFGLNYNYRVQQSFLPRALFSGDPTDTEVFVPIPFQQNFQGNANLQLEQLLFKGSYFVGLEAAKKLKEQTEKEYIISKEDVAEAVSKAYYAALISREQKTLADQNFQRIDSLYRETRLLFENGFAESLDLLRSQVEFNNVKIEKERADQAAYISIKLLKLQMGMPVETPVELTNDLGSAELYLDEQILNSFSYQRRNDYSLLQTNLELAKIDLKNERVKYLPELSAFANYGAIGSGNDFSEATDFGTNWFGFGAIGATIKVPIFDGLRKTNIIRQKKYRIDQIDNQFKQIENNINLEIEQKQQELQVELSNVNTQRQNVELAEEIYRASKLKYDEGIGSSLEVTDANTSLKSAQTNYFASLYEAIIKKIELEKALGILLDQ